MIKSYRFQGDVFDDKNFNLFQHISELAADIFLEHKEGCNDKRASHIIYALAEVANNPPAFNLGQYWAYPELAATIGMAKRTEHIWTNISENNKEKLSLIMEVFLYLGAFATHRDNNYHTGFAWTGNFSKKWNPNVSLSVYPLMIYCIDFFGSIDLVNDMLCNFSFDTLVEKLEVHTFDRCIKCWTAEPCMLPDGSYAPTAKNLLENGGTAYIKDSFGNILHAGYGIGIRQPYKQWNGGIWYLPGQLINPCFAGGKCCSKIDVDGDNTFDGYIMDNSVSDAEGLEGMYTEFNTKAGTQAAIRSSLHYCLVDFILINTVIAYCKEIGWFIHPGRWIDEGYRDKVIVGNTDLIYKAAHGYHGMNLNAKEIITPEIVSTYYPAYSSWKNYWENYLKPCI